MFILHSALKYIAMQFPAAETRACDRVLARISLPASILPRCFIVVAEGCDGNCRTVLPKDPGRVVVRVKQDLEKKCETKISFRNVSGVLAYLRADLFFSIVTYVTTRAVSQ